ncbi:MAG TPA: site-specific integrase [Methylocella sp.]|nr:site-specific integrase [Methylocella sp.]
MPRAAKGAYLWLRPAERDEDGRVFKSARWIIKDGGRQFGTGCGAGDREAAERKLAAHIVAKHQPKRHERPISEILIADVINIYLVDVAPRQSRPEKAAERAERLIEFFGGKTLDQITGALCREYEMWRAGKGRSNKGKGGGAKRDLEDLRAAINHHQAEGLHRETVRIVLPKCGQARQRWLTRDEAAKLLWICWKTREIQEGIETDKRPLRHLCRFLPLGLYTGSRPGAVLKATWDRGPGRSWIDVDRGVFHRRADGERETNKRQPTVKLSSKLLAHLRRWRRFDGGRGYVVTFAGQPIGGVRTALQRAVRLAKLDSGVTAYTLRHSCASWLVAKGLPTRKIADFLGTSEAMIERHYGHLAPDYQDEAALAIGRK